MNLQLLQPVSQQALEKALIISHHYIKISNDTILVKALKIFRQYIKVKEETIILCVDCKSWLSDFSLNTFSVVMVIYHHYNLELCICLFYLM